MKQQSTARLSFNLTPTLTLTVVMAIALAVVLAPGTFALSFETLEVSPASPGTSSTLTCVINASGTGTLSANVSWYLNGGAWPSDTETISLSAGVETTTSLNGSIKPVSTTKGQQWRCQAILGNTTDTLAQNSSQVTIANSAPIITAPSTPQSILEDQEYYSLATATDPDSDSIIAFISSDLNSSLYNNTQVFTISSSGVINFTPPQSMVGNHTVAILAYDGESWGGTNILFEVIFFDDPPIIDNPGDQNASVGTNFSVELTASDEEGDELNFSLVTNGTLVLTNINGTTATLTFPLGYPTAGDVGEYSAEVTVYQVSNASKNDTAVFTVTITEPNEQPQFVSIPNTNATQGDLFEWVITANDSNALDQLVFSITTPSCPLLNPWNITTDPNASTLAVGTVNLTLNNTHIACRNINLRVSDYTAGGSLRSTTTQQLTLNLTNINDPPQVHELSISGLNYLAQTNMSSLQAAQGLAFNYQVNATDPDNYTYQGDTLTYSTNTSFVSINSATGLISFTPNASQVGTHLINITVIDLSAAQASRTMTLTVNANTAPTIVPLGSVVCQEAAECIMTFEATDGDAAENITFTSNSTLLTNFIKTAFNISVVNRTYTNNEVGNYTITVTATDKWGSTGNAVMNLVVNNTNNAPFFDSNRDNVSNPLTLAGPVVAAIEKVWDVIVTDPDHRNVVDNLIFSVNVTGPNPALFGITKINNYTGRIQFTPQASDIGSYTVNVTVTDGAGLFASEIIAFDVVNGSLPPSITGAVPFVNGSVQINDTLTTTSDDTTAVSYSENTTVNFNISFSDPDTSLVNMTVRYYRNGVLVSTPSVANPVYSFYFDFFSSGSHIVMAVVEDNLLSNDTFTWTINIDDVKRAPIMVAPFINRTINQTTILNGEMTIIDPDDDLNSNNVIDGSEVNTLTYSAPSNDYFDTSFEEDDVTITLKSSGQYTFQYTATTAVGSLSLDSNEITYSIFYNPTENSNSPSSSSSRGGGGGGGGGGAVVIPRPQPDPYAIDIVVPKPITVYDNGTVIAPLAIVNTGNITLRDITLTAYSEADVTLGFLASHIDELLPDEVFNTSLGIKDYKLGGTFEVFVTARVEDPSFNDSAVFYVNSIEKGSSGDAVNVRITSARDLLTHNPLCGELTQLVDQAQAELGRGNLAEAQELLNAVYEGCSYLNTVRTRELQEPSIVEGIPDNLLNWGLGALLVLLVVIGVTLVAHYARQE